MKEIINADNAPTAVGPYVHAIKSGNFVITSGQLGINPGTGELGEGIEDQTNWSLKNLEAVLNKADFQLRDVIKTTVFLKDMEDFAQVNAIYAAYFKENTPARSCVQVAKLPKDGLVEIEAIALK